MSDLFDLPPDRPLPITSDTPPPEACLSRRHRTRSRRFIARWRNTGIVVGLGLGLSVGGGVALAQGVFSRAPQPGSPSEARLAAPVVATRTGTATIYLGRAPHKANAISLTLTGLSVGTFHFPGTAKHGVFPKRHTSPWSRRLPKRRGHSARSRATHGHDHHERRCIVETSSNLRPPGHYGLESQHARANIRRAEQERVSRSRRSGPKRAERLRQIVGAQLPSTGPR